MASLLETVDDLVAAVRSQLDEANDQSGALDTETDILPALNRAQVHAASTLARNYPEPLLTKLDVTLVAGTAEYSLPEDISEDRLVKVEINVSGTYREVQRISYRDISNYETTGTALAPSYYCIIGRKYRLVPAPDGVYAARIWYLRKPDKLVSPQGRIVVVNTAGNYVVVDAAGADLSTTSDNLASYVNVIDGQTGLVKMSLQILSITNNKLTFRGTPLRTSVLGRTISTAITSTDVERDDYICLAKGTCVVQPLGDTITNFIIQYAVAEMTRKLGGDVPPEKDMLENLEKQVTRTENGREQAFRIKKTAKAWGGANSRRWWGPRSNS
jgi:hypothetical protein